MGFTIVPMDLSNKEEVDTKEGKRTYPTSGKIKSIEKGSQDG